MVLIIKKLFDNNLKINCIFKNCGIKNYSNSKLNVGSP